MSLLHRLRAGETLDDAALTDLLDTLAGPGDVDHKRDLLTALADKGVLASELAGLARAMRSRAVPVAAPEGAVDTCGTGGDGSNSFNVSTATALVVAAAGVPVVKHGNRAVSGRCGSADLLEAAGVPLSATAADAELRLREHGFAFLFAPAFHPATAAIGPVRKALGRRTAFNLLGPLSNPAAPPFQLVGAATMADAEAIAHALSQLGLRRAYVVHGAPSWDEATPCGPFWRWDVTPGAVAVREIDPLFTYGLRRCAPDDLGGGDAPENAAILSALVHGRHGAVRDAVLLNAALVLELCGIEASPKDALARAAEAVDNGRTAWLLDRLAVGA